MQRTIKAYLIISNVVAAVFLAFTSERFNEGVEVIKWYASPVLTQIRDDNAKQVHVNEGEQHNGDEMARGSFARILAKVQTQAIRAMTEVRIIAAWLLVNAVLLGWFLGRRQRAGTVGTMSK